MPGQWDFVIESETPTREALALPLQFADARVVLVLTIEGRSSGSFCSHRVSNGDWFAGWHGQSMLTRQTVYEQDWLDVEFQNMYYLMESATAGSTWLNQACV